MTTTIETTTAIATLLALATVTLALLFFLRRGRKKSLPPGSRGLPLLGETLKMISFYKTDNPDPFVDERVKKHGKVFTTHLFGETTVFSTDPEVNKRLLHGEGKLVESSNPASLAKLLGGYSPIGTKGAVYKRLYSLILGTFANASVLRDHLLPDIDRLVRSNLDGWKDGQVLRLLECTKKITFELAVKRLLSCEPGEWTEELRKHYHTVVDGFFSLPIALPFSAFSRALKARKQILELIKPIVRERMTERVAEKDQVKERRVVGGKDMLDMLLEKGEVNREEEAVDFSLFLLVAGYETTPTLMTFVVKYLSETPRALAVLKEEHDAIMARKNRSDPLAWSDYKSSMPFTQCVISEALRLGNIVSGVFRRTIDDVDVNGYLIPKGCKVFTSFRAVHLDPNYYEDSRTFNPWRWQQQSEAKTPRPSAPSQQPPANIFTPFGAGQRMCPGYELARLEISVFLHYLVTTFRWEATVKDSIVYFPTSRIVQGYPICVHRLVNTGGA